MAYDPNGRIKRASRGVLHNPGMCCVCNNVTGDTYADLDTFVEFFGNLYLCEACTNSAAEVFGGLRPVNEQGLREHIASLEASCDKLTEENEQLGKLNESLRTSFDDLSRRYWRSDDVSDNEDAAPDNGSTKPAPEIINGEPIRDPESAQQSDEPDLGELDSDLANNDDSDSDDSLAGLREAVAGASGGTSEPGLGKRSDGRAAAGRLFGE